MMAIDFDPVEGQLAAYNARNVDAFLANYTADCVVEDGEGNRLMSGHTEMRERYRALFDGSPHLHCTVVHRTRVGEYVFDEESITGRLPGTQPQVRRAMAIYRIDPASGLICHVRFMRELG